LDYADFLEQKRIKVTATGIDVPEERINSKLFDYQHDITRWALKKGKAALFEGCGLGKTPQMLEWANHVFEHTWQPVLILAPLAVAEQTVTEGQKFGIEVNPCNSKVDIIDGINVTNYEKLDRFNPDEFSGIVLDESSILKAFDGKMRNQIIDAFHDTPYKLACSATPSPNDYMELANHAEFLGVMTRAEMLAMFFVHDGGKTSQWRLKGHAQEEYWKWVASWAVMMQSPADLGYYETAERFMLPELNLYQHTILTGREQVKTLAEQRQAAKDTLQARVKKCAEIVNDTRESFIIWCNLNDESDALVNAIEGAVQIRGSDSPDYKKKVLAGFTDGSIKRLVTKPSIAGFGLNWQHCHNEAFVGLSHSFEQWYQAVRRCWRFGQEEDVNVHVISSDVEGAVVENIKRKETEFENMLRNMISATQEITKENIAATKRDSSIYDPKLKMYLPPWLKEAM
jgi:superfamily II DNA or RNA helicase